HHERIEHHLRGEHDAERAAPGVLARLEELQIVQQEVDRQPHRQRDQREQMQMGREEAKRLPEHGAHYLTLEPEGTSLSRVSRDTVPSCEAASTMPLEWMPIRVAGSRLATMTTFRPTRLAGSYASAMPATRVRVSSPTLIESLRSFLDFGTRSAARTSATRRSTFWNSVIGILPSPECPSPGPRPRGERGEGAVPPSPRGRGPG